MNFFPDVSSLKIQATAAFILLLFGSPMVAVGSAVSPGVVVIGYVLFLLSSVLSWNVLRQQSVERIQVITQIYFMAVNVVGILSALVVFIWGHQ